MPSYDIPPCPPPPPSLPAYVEYAQMVITQTSHDAPPVVRSMSVDGRLVTDSELAQAQSALEHNPAMMGELLKKPPTLASAAASFRSTINPSSAAAAAPSTSATPDVESIKAAIARLESEPRAAVPDRLLAQEFKPMYNKRGKMIQRACKGAGVCNFALCDHGLAGPSGSGASSSSSAAASSSGIDPIILSGLMKFCEKQGFKISEPYARKQLEQNGRKLPIAYKALVKELSDREQELSSTGRVLMVSPPFPNGVVPKTTYYHSHPDNAHLKLPTNRDQYITHMEYEDQCLKALLKSGWDSPFGFSILHHPLHKSTVQQQKAFYALYQEAKYRDDRSVQYKLIYAGAETTDEKEKLMQAWEATHMPSTAALNDLANSYAPPPPSITATIPTTPNTTKQPPVPDTSSDALSTIIEESYAGGSSKPDVAAAPPAEDEDEKTNVQSEDKYAAYCKDQDAQLAREEYEKIRIKEFLDSHPEIEPEVRTHIQEKKVIENLKLFCSELIMENRHWRDQNDRLKANQMQQLLDEIDDEMLENDLAVEDHLREMGFGSDEEDDDELPYDTPYAPPEPEHEYALGEPSDEAILRVASEVVGGEVGNALLSPDVQKRLVDEWKSKLGPETEVAPSARAKGKGKEVLSGAADIEPEFVPSARDKGKGREVLVDTPEPATAPVQHPVDSDEDNDDGWIKDDIEPEAASNVSGYLTNPAAVPGDAVKVHDFTPTKQPDPVGTFVDKSTMEFWHELFDLNTDFCGGLCATEDQNMEKVRWLKKTCEFESMSTAIILYAICGGSHMLAAKFYARVLVPKIIAFMKVRDGDKRNPHSKFELEIARFGEYCAGRRKLEVKGAKGFHKKYDALAAREAKNRKAAAAAARTAEAAAAALVEQPVVAESSASGAGKKKNKNKKKKSKK